MTRSVDTLDRRHVTVSGHVVTQFVAASEPPREYQKALRDLAEALPAPDELARHGARLDTIITTPDFHPGKPVPVGVVADLEGAVMPHFIGSDIGCGMRMLVLDGSVADALAAPDLERHLRHLFFQGGRDIALTGAQRAAVLREGVPGLLDALATGRTGLLAGLDMGQAWKDADRMSDGGWFPSGSIEPAFAQYADAQTGLSHDSILGSVGGGNHFVEIGTVDEIPGGGFARTAGISPGAVVIVVHSGSLDFGQRVGSQARETLAGSRLFAEDDPRFARYRDGHANAVNAAFVNRFFLGLMAVEAVSRTLGRKLGHRLVYDAPHNTIWQDGAIWRHRKGACPAGGPGFQAGSPYEWLGEPVILPGSMGDGSWLLRGLGHTDALASSAHGAGRKLSRGDARRTSEGIGALRVVGPVAREDLRTRPDVLAELDGRLREEAPSAYRPIEAVVEPMEQAGMVARVARIRPVVTVKG